MLRIALIAVAAVAFSGGTALAYGSGRSHVGDGIDTAAGPFAYSRAAIAHRSLRANRVALRDRDGRTIAHRATSGGDLDD